MESGKKSSIFARRLTRVARIETNDDGLFLNFSTFLSSNSGKCVWGRGRNFRKNWMNSENVRNAVVFFLNLPPPPREFVGKQDFAAIPICNNGQSIPHNMYVQQNASIAH